MSALAAYVLLGLDLRAGLARRPGSQRHADLPLVAKWVDDPAEPPAVLVAHRGRFRLASADRLPDDPLGVFDHEQRSAGRPIDCARLNRFMTVDVAATQNA